MRRETGKHGDGTRVELYRHRAFHVLQATVAQRRAVMCQRALSVQAGNDPGTAVVEGRISQRDPAGQVLLRFDVGVAVVLMPGKLPIRPRLLVHRLVPVQPYVRTNQVVHKIAKYAMRRELAQHGVALHQMGMKGDLAGPRNAMDTVRPGLQKRFDLGLNSPKNSDPTGWVSLNSNNSLFN